ncbi:MAG: redox-regulated ATPase YchF [SAR202 cluster bacterium]|nr:redox-regulated ATPase YchF [SAR202 cluster bacterium]
MEIALIGLPSSGKTTLFNVLTGGAQQAPVRGKAGIGVAKILDTRLDALSKVFNPKKTTFAEITFWDIPAAVGEDGQQRAIGGQFLNQLQSADAFLHVVRAFDDPTVPHSQGSVDPLRDLEALDAELAFSDLAILERRVQRIADSLKGARGNEREQLLREQPLIQRVKESLEKDVPLRQQTFTGEESKTLANYQLLTSKPQLIVMNIGEEDLGDQARADKLSAQASEKHGMRALAVCGKLESELSQLSAEEQREFRQSLGAGESAVGRLVRECLEMVGMSTFLTVGPDEVRGWVINKEMAAVKAAGRIHSDIERGFIRAEVVSYDDFMACGSLAEARKRGVLRSEGKTYPVKDGDIINFLFSV